MAHRKKIKHYHEPGHLHEFTFSCYQRRALLTDDSWRERLSSTLDEAGRIEQFDLVAFVFMPEHFYLLVNPRQQFPEVPFVYGPAPGACDSSRSALAEPVAHT